MQFAFCISLCLCGGFFSPVRAAEPRTLTLYQALELADSRNRDIQKAREYYRQVEGRYVEERAAALPQLTVTGSVARKQDDSQRVIAGGLFPTLQDSRSAEIALSQALFTWGKVGAAIRAARKGFQSADELLRISRQDARRDVATAFYDILLAREQHAIAVQNLGQKERHLDEARRRHDAGVATDYDVLAAQVAVANARPEVIRTDNQIRAARDRLRFVLAVEEDLEVSGTLEAAPVPLLSYAEALELARKRRPELEELRRREEIAAELVTIANAEDKPRLDLKGGYGWSQLETGAARGDGQTWSAGVFLSFPIFDGLKTRGKVAQAESDLRTLRIDEQRLAEAIALEIRNAVNAVREAEEIVTALAGTAGQAERLLAMAEKGFELGVKIRLEVEDAELSLLQARGNLARARRDWLVARVSLERAMGVLGE
ncbi:MAG: TolC family protein [Geobacteraceae bacterium]|nr:TolC family protein [Geobacteraceae bacterium]